VIPSPVGSSVPTRQTTIVQARIVPRMGYNVVEIVYERAPVPAPSPCPACWRRSWRYYPGAIASDKAGFIPHLMNGRLVTSIHQFYHKRRALLQPIGPSIMTTHHDTTSRHHITTPHHDTTSRHHITTPQMERLTAHRTRQIDHYLHTASRRIIDLLVAEGVGTLVIGKNPPWKQEANSGSEFWKAR
jgi:putative transposase